MLGIARAVCEHADDDEVRTAFGEIALQLVVEQPFKTPFVAAVVVVVNSMRSEVVREVLERAAGLVNEAVRRGAWREVKLYLKFLAGLQGVLAGEGVFPVLEDILGKAVDLQTENNEEVSKMRWLLSFINVWWLIFFG